MFGLRGFGIRMKFIPLTEMKLDEVGIISCLNCGGNCCQRLCDLGLTKGTKVKMLRYAPMNGPVEISVRGTNLVIGKGMASKIYVEVKERVLRI